MRSRKLVFIEITPNPAPISANVKTALKILLSIGVNNDKSQYESSVVVIIRDETPKINKTVKIIFVNTLVCKLKRLHRVDPVNAA